MSGIKVCVVGAGVIGLSTAVQVLQNIPGVKVTIKAEHLTPNTTSDGIAGLWEPYLLGDTPLDKVRQWGGDTFTYLHQLARSPEAADAGAFMVSGYHLHHDIKPEPFWKDIVLGFRPMTQKELQAYPGHGFGFHYTTVTSEGRKYVPWLLQRFKNLGGQLVQEKVHSLSDLCDDYDVVINCSGMGARELCQDKGLFPTKGQLMRLSAPWIKTFVIAEDEEYVILLGGDTIFLGGVSYTNDYSKELNQKDQQKMFDACCRLEPSLRKSEHVSDWVGFRPTRASVRLETETIMHKNKHRQVIHNYGHGGAGMSLHWGCAKEAVRLLTDALYYQNHAKL